MKLVSAYVGGEGKRSGLWSKKYLLSEKKNLESRKFFLKYGNKKMKLIVHKNIT